MSRGISMIRSIEHLPRNLVLVATLGLLFAACGSPAERGPLGEKARDEEGSVPERVAAVLEAGPPAPILLTANPRSRPIVRRHNPFENERIFGTSEDWEPALAVDPSNASLVYQVVTRFGGAKACGTCPDPALILHRSTDGGATWGPDEYICGVACAGTTDQDDPQIAVANDGSVYAAWLESFVPGVTFSKSTDHGATWSSPYHVAPSLPGGTDKPWLVISPDGHDVYIGFNDSDSYVVSSHDGGLTFSSAVKTSSDTNYWFAEGGAVAPNGDVYLAESAEPAAGANLELLRSTDGGATWSTTQMDTSQNGATCGGGCISDFYAAQSSIAIDSAGTMMYLYAANAAAKANKTLYFRTSIDGVTWTARQALNTVGDSNFPQVVSGGVNNFRVAWEDNSAGANLWNVFYRETSTAGQTWGRKKSASNVGTGASYKSAGGFAFPYGDYFEMDVSPNNRTFLIWGEGVSYTGLGGVWYSRSSR
jgi:hypothetical protein